MDLRADSSWIDVDDGVWLRVLQPEGWTLQRLELPSLRVVTTYQLPHGPQRGKRALVGDGDSGAGPDDPLVVIADGLMSAIDRRQVHRSARPSRAAGSIGNEPTPSRARACGRVPGIPARSSCRTR